ncbi:MAG: caspase family protein [Phocaeicola sp.]
MKRKKVLFLLAITSLVSNVMAQSPAMSKANIDFDSFVSQNNAGNSNASMYETLYSSYRTYSYVVKNNINDKEGLAGLRKVYPYMIDGAVYFSQQNQPVKALDFALAYIDIPNMQAFRNERFSRSDYYPTICYFAATTAYNNKRFDEAIRCFRCYIQTGEQKNMENSYTYLARAYKFSGDFRGQLSAIDEAVKAFPTTANFLYEAINACIENKDDTSLDRYVTKALSLNPHDTKVLPIKAKILADKGNYVDAYSLYERLYKVSPNDFNICRMYATVSYNYAAQLINGANSLSNKTAYQQQRQKANGYLQIAAGIFERIVAVYPNETKYMASLADTYRCMGRDADANRLISKIQQKGGTYVASNVTSLGSAPTQGQQAGKASTVTSKPQQSSPSYGGEGITLADVPAFSSYAKNYVESAINKWQVKDDYETLQEYKERVTDKARDEKIQQLALEAEHKYIDEYGNRVKLDNLRLEKYDAENGVFLITSPDFGNMLLPVPRNNNEARNFESQWNSVKFDDPQFCVAGDKLTLAQLTFRTNTGKRYVYNNDASLTYQNTQINYNFESVDMSTLTAQTSNNPHAQGPKIENASVNVGKSDIDINIPTSKKSNENLFAVIISNENYRRESKVQFANNDGEAFRNYCLKTLGCPDKNVHYVADATFNDMKAEMDWMKTVADAYAGKAKMIFYYAGHGVPDEASKSAYLLPVDGYGANISTGYSLDNLYATLGSLPSEQVTVFLDACFSGSQRDGTTMASSARGVAIKAKNSVPKGNVVVVTAASGSETAYPYKEKGHGLFTYFLLKKLKETKGNVNYGELVDYVHEEVAKKSIVENNKSQTPSCTPSTTVGEQWRKWNFKD